MQKLFPRWKKRGWTIWLMGSHWANGITMTCFSSVGVCQNSDLFYNTFYSSRLNFEAFLREFTYLQILRLVWNESMGQEHFEFRGLQIVRAVFPLSEKEEKRNRRLELANIFLNRCLLLLPSQRHAEVTDTSHLHKPPFATSHKLGVDKRINPTAL